MAAGPGATDGVALVRSVITDDRDALCLMLRSMTCAERCDALLFLVGFSQSLLAEVAAGRSTTPGWLLDECVARWAAT